jgi:hypothetical protein
MFFFKLIQVLPWTCIDCKLLHDGMYLSPNHIHFIIHLLVYSLNTRSLPLHKNDVFSDYNIKTTHILCLSETHFNTLTSNNISLNIHLRIHSMINVNGWNGTMIIYNNFTTLSSQETFISLEVEHIVTTFNANIQTFNIIFVSVHNLSSNVFGSNANFLSHDNNWWFQYWHAYQNSTQPNELQNFMNQYSVKLQFEKIITIYESHIDHIWTNASI